MKRIAAGLIFGALVMAAPLASHAAPGCVGSTKPSPRGTVTAFPSQVDPNGKVWVYNNTSPAGEAGVSGTHGWLDAKGSSSGVNVAGDQAESGVNGTVSVSPNASTSNPRVAVSVCLGDN
ncbi:MAG: hypothetical protein ACYDCC_06305 [Actinomycetota bacterium]